MRRNRFLLIPIIFLLLAGLTLAKRPLKVEDLYKMKRISQLSPSPDGRYLAFVVTHDCLKEDTSYSSIYIYDLEKGALRRLTRAKARDTYPVWSPDGRRLAFLSDRSGKNQIWVIDPTGGEAKQLTNFKSGFHGPLIWSPDGRYLLAYSRIKEEGYEKPYKELKHTKVKIMDNLYFRQWNRWLLGKRNHLFVVDVSSGRERQLTKGKFDTPPISLSSGRDYDLSPDGKEVAFVFNPDKRIEISTNNDVFVLPFEGGKYKRISVSKGRDVQPRYSPDGRYIAFTSMQTPGYESDTARLVLYDRRTGKIRSLTDSLDRSVYQFVWSPDSRYIYFTARDLGRMGIYRVDVESGDIQLLDRDGYSLYLTISAKGDKLFFVRSYAHKPDEIYELNLKDSREKQLTNLNEAFLKEIEMKPLEEFWFRGAGGVKVHGFILKPPQFREGRKYPAVLVIHGGPQGMWADRFLWRWFNYQLVAAPGYVAIMINPRGSDGYGAKFRAEVSRDYGGRCYQDLMKGLDYAIRKYKYIDPNRLAAVGGSFGGYMVNWIAGYTKRFKALVSHAGLYNLISFYGTTEELWFPEWDMGRTPWKEKRLYEKWSPHNYAQNFSTPMLVTHGEQDFRVAISEGLQLFTALRRQGVEARFVYFPDEGHVIQKPQNNLVWWREIHRWLAKYLK